MVPDALSSSGGRRESRRAELILLSPFIKGPILLISCCDKTLTEEPKEEMVSSGHDSRLRPIVVGKLRQLEASGRVSSTIREQRGMKAAAQLPFSA